ncbi:hypothetical protein APHAL10511_008210 [Amanita phalloides]|nr:hypothetical protein APHAL10511_008210 [Amanita phalloides]
MYRSYFHTFFTRQWARPNYRRHLVIATLSSGTLGFGLTKLRASPNESSDTSASPPLSSLVRAYTVYSMCSIPSLVDYSPQIFRILSSIPVVKQITEAFVRVTFFNQFVGGDSARDTIPLIRSLRAANKGTLLGYCVEVDANSAVSNHISGKGSAPHKRFVEEMIRSIDAGADFEDSLGNHESLDRRTWIAVKITALLPDAHALIKLSNHIIKTRLSQSAQVIPFPGCPTPSDLSVLYASKQTSDLTQMDIDSLRELHADLERICVRARERGVKVIIDAEYSWYQPALDALQLSLMRKFNTVDHTSNDVQPLVYGTWQAYLRRTPGHLAEALRDARKHNYALGVKLVRGAYHGYEVAAHNGGGSKHGSVSISPDPEPPVWTTKPETDACYNSSVRTLVEAVAADIRSSRAANSRSVRGSWPISRTSRKDSGITHRAPRIAVLFGTHNWESCDAILDELVKAGLASKVESREEGKQTVVSVREETLQRVAIAQLYGMYDELTDSLVDRTISKAPLVMKYVPYGVLSEVMPYLGRRAVENKSVLGQGAAARERKRVWKQICTRISNYISYN